MTFKQCKAQIHYFLQQRATGKERKMAAGWRTLLLSEWKTGGEIDAGGSVIQSERVCVRGKESRNLITMRWRAARAIIITFCCHHL